MTALISGSIAFDAIMVFDGQFKDHILPNEIHILNVSFLVPQMRREYGGCAGNIAFNLAMLDAPCVPFGSVGSDAAPYLTWLAQHGIATGHIKVCDDQLTAQAFITTDLDDNQITAFHPGAMGAAEEMSIDTVADVGIGIVAPNAKPAMLRHAREFKAAGIPFIFDPGQALPQFTGEELLHCIELADHVTVNDYEWRLISDRTGLDTAAIASKVKALIVTQGGEGSTIHVEGEAIHIPAVPPAGVVDPTGCGDAYRAGILYGLMHGLEWAHTGAIASFLGSLKIAQRGTQNHHRPVAELNQMLRDATGYALIQ